MHASVTSKCHIPHRTHKALHHLAQAGLCNLISAPISISALQSPYTAMFHSIFCGPPSCWHSSLLCLWHCGSGFQFPTALVNVVTSLSLRRLYRRRWGVRDEFNGINAYYISIRFQVQIPSTYIKIWTWQSTPETGRSWGSKGVGGNAGHSFKPITELRIQWKTLFQNSRKQ